ncbi:MAG: hypothetical protein Q9181_007333 [Wetmoreana brouardii]
MRSLTAILITFGYLFSVATAGTFLRTDVEHGGFGQPGCDIRIKDVCGCTKSVDVDYHHGCGDKKRKKSQHGSVCEGTWCMDGNESDMSVYYTILDVPEPFSKNHARNILQKHYDGNVFWSDYAVECFDKGILLKYRLLPFEPLFKCFHMLDMPHSRTFEEFDKHYLTSARARNLPYINFCEIYANRLLDTYRSKPETLDIDEVRIAADADKINSDFAEHPTHMLNRIETYYEVRRSILDHESCNAQGQKFATELRKRFADPEYMRKHQHSHQEWEKQFDMRPQAGECPPRYPPGHHEWKKQFDVRPQASECSPKHPPGCGHGAGTKIKDEPAATAAAAYNDQTEGMLKRAQDSEDDEGPHSKRRAHISATHDRKSSVSSDGEVLKAKPAETSHEIIEPKVEPPEVVHEVIEISDDEEEDDVPLYSAIKYTTTITIQNRAPCSNEVIDL